MVLITIAFSKAMLCTIYNHTLNSKILNLQISQLHVAL